MQLLVTCTAQEPMITVENKEGEQNREPLKSDLRRSRALGFEQGAAEDGALF